MSGDRHQPLFDVHPVTGASIEVFYADGLATFGRRGAGWFWWRRRRGFAPEGKATEPFPTSYSAFQDALQRCTDPHNSGERSQGFRLGADRAGACVRQAAAEQIASEAARAAARAEANSVQNLLKYQLPVSAIGGESGIRTHGTVSRTHAFQACALSHSAISPDALS